MSFVPAFHVLLATYFSLYPFLGLSYSTGYYFISSHNRPAKPSFKNAEIQEKGHI